MNEKIDKVKSADDLASLISLVVDSDLENNIQRKIEFIKEVLKDSLVNNFFKSAEIKVGSDCISFSNNKFNVQFSAVRPKRIIIINLMEEVSEPLKPSELDIKAYNLIKTFLNNKNKTNASNLVNYHNSRFLIKMTNYDKYIGIYTRKGIKELKNNLAYYESQQDEYDEQVKQYPIKLEEYMERQNTSKVFLDEILESDLHQFQDDGWIIGTIRIKTNEGND